MSQKRKDKRGRLLNNGETQDPITGEYRFSYYVDGKRKNFRSWRLNPTDPTPTDPTPTDPEEPEPAAQPIKCRFISWKYFEDESRNLVPETKGGLAENCRWATDQSLREILRQALWSRI